MKDLPPVNAFSFLQRVREVLHTFMGRGNSEERVVTLGELINAGLVDDSGSALTPGPAVTPSDEPDLTVPPTPTGLAVAAGLTRLIIETDEPTYTAGHGHDRAILYGATYPGTGPLPTFGEAVELKTFLGSITDYVTNTGTAWHIWVKWQSVDGVLSAPAGGTNGVTATTGKVGTSDLNDLIITSQKLAAGSVDALAKFGAGLEPVYNVATLPSASGYTGPKTVYNQADGKLYRYVAGAWTTAVPTTDLTGQVTNAQITDSAVTAAKIASGAINVFDKFAGGLEPVSAVGTLPSPSGYTGPKTVLLTTDNKLYRHTGSAWTSAVPTTDLTGQVTDAQIAALAASKVTGQLTDAQLAAIAAAKITGQIVTTQITDDAITTPKIAAGAVTAAEIAANTITAGQIAAGTITATEIAAGTITGAKIAAGTITAGNIAADTITANEIAANAITASEIATDAVTANKILAGSVTTAKIAAGAVTANEIAANTIIAGNIAAGAVTANKFFVAPVEGASLSIDPNFADSTAWALLSGTAGTFTTITDGVVGNNILRSASAAASVYGNARLIPLDATKAYRVRARVRRDATANGTLTIAVALQDSSGANIAVDGTYWNHQAANAVTASTTFTTYTHTFGAGTAKTFPGTARTMNPVALLNTGGSAGYMEVQDFRIEEVIPGELIVDGAIVAGKIATDAVTANKIQAGAVVAGKLAASAIVAADGVIANGAITNALIGTAAVDTAKIADAAIVTAKIADANVTTAKIADANITTAKIADANITTAKIADASITNAKINDLNASKITAGTIDAARIAAASITTDKILVGAATVAAASNNSTDVVSLSGTITTATKNDLVTLTTTGAPVTVWLALWVDVQSTNTFDFYVVTADLKVDSSGSTPVAHSEIYLTPWMSSKRSKGPLSVVWRSTALSAASHTFGFQVQVSGIVASTGNPVSMTTGSVTWVANMVVMENKV
jgi:hypothetical protein